MRVRREPGLLDVALGNRPDYQQALLSIDSAKIGVLLAKNNRLWDLDLTGGFSVGSTAPTFAEMIRGLRFSEPDWRVGLNLNIPIGDLTREQGLIASKTNLQTTELGNQGSCATASSSPCATASAMSGPSGCSSSRPSRSRELNEQKLEIEREKLSLGLSSNFQVVTFENDLSASQNNELSATINYLNALTQLDQTLGTTLDTWKIELTY